jgi:FtsZ-binding cell division protein ZapB
LNLKSLDDLENKVQTLITTLETVRGENERFRQELLENSSKITAMESDNNRLKQELDTLKTDTTGQKSKLETVAERIRSILNRLESVH